MKTYILVGLIGFVLFQTTCSTDVQKRADDTTGDTASGETVTGTDADTDTGIDTDTGAETDTGIDTDTDVDSDTTFDCGISARATLSSEISTVGIVTWSTPASFSSATIEFGRDRSRFEFSAPVNLDEADYRTVLLGMKPNTTYYYRVLLDTGCASEVYALDTGAQAILPTVELDTRNPSALSGDFVVTSTEGYAVILDGDGDYVWWYNLGALGGNDAGISRAHISGDGKSMWGGNINVHGGMGRLYRVDIDGEGGAEIFDIDRHHDFCVLPDNSVAYIEFVSDKNGTCDRIVERSASGQTTVIYDLRDDFSPLAESPSYEYCHSNAIHYVPAQDAYYVSVLNQNTIIKVSRSGRLQWALDGDGNEVDGVPYLTGVSWRRQHGLHLFSDGRLLIFNNSGSEKMFGTGSLALEISLDEGGGTASETWRYDGGSSSQTLGDVQKLSSGNVLVTYSNNSVMHEVAPSGMLVRAIRLNGGLGYSDARSSLYGDPERW